MMVRKPAQPTCWTDLATFVVMLSSLGFATVVTVGQLLHLWPVAGGVVSFAAGLAMLMTAVRLISAIMDGPSQRSSQISLLVALLLWGAGSMVISLAGAGAHAEFPSPAESLFLASCAGLMGHVMLDRPHLRQIGRKTVIDAAILAGGAAVIAGLLLFNPFLDVSGHRQGGQLLVLIYPLVDLMLAVLVAVQISLRIRARTINSGGTVLALLVFFCADVFLINAAASKAYDYGELPPLLWACAWALLVESARRSAREPGDVALPRSYSGYGVSGAAVVSLLVLVLRPRDAIGTMLVCMAVVTLLLVALRLLIALHEAHLAADAVRLALTDDLTGLPNRRAVFKELDGFKANADVGVLMIDLDGFKEVNDSLGHTVGDDLLQTVASRIRLAVIDGTVARLGGDEFFVLTETVDAGQLLTMASEIRGVIRKPFRIDGLDLRIDSSVGITTSESARRPADFLRQSDIAMYRAKQERLGACFYDSDSDTFGWERLHILSELREAIANRRLEVWFQPQVSAKDGAVSGVEALVRWRSAEGMIPPSTFLPIARRAGLMSDLSLCVVDSVLHNLVLWRERGIELPVAVNIAPAELLKGPVLAHLFHEMARMGLPGNSVMIEITEDSFISDPVRAGVVIDEIHAHGMSVSLDDYGSGFSSLAHLKKIDAQELKIDRSFISAIVDDSRSRTIVGATIQMARGLGMRTVAEGVEDAETVVDLKRLDVDVLQGFHLAQPMSSSALLSWLEGRPISAEVVFPNSRRDKRHPAEAVDAGLLRWGR